jgi:CBS domain containing-hemolysin-like protein
MVTVLTPIIWLCQLVTRLIPRQTGEALVSAREVRAIATLSRKSGEIDPEQERVIANILELRHKTVRQAMTPRTVTFSLSEHLTLAEAKEMQNQWLRHSRVPVYDENPDDVVGIVLRQDLLSSLVSGEESRQLTDIMLPVHFVPESASLNRVLVDFLERRQHLFVVVDEYGGVTGVISMEDILEEIVGREIVDESDQASDMRELARQKRQTLRG